MPNIRALTLAFAGLAALSVTAQGYAQSTTAPAEAWQIGPIIKGRNYSVGMPLTPDPVRQGIFSFDFPGPTAREGHAHYLTFPHGPLSGKSRIVMRYRIEAERGARFVPQEQPDLPATIRLYFQRQGDNWSGRKRYQWYRWYAPASTVKNIAPGVFEMSADLKVTGWVPVVGGPNNGRADAFQDAMDNAGHVGFVMGSHSRAGHGVYSTQPARFTLLDFRII